MKAIIRVLMVVLALMLLGGVMAHLTGFFQTKIPTDFSPLPTSFENAGTFTVGITAEPLIEQAAGTLRAKTETVISPLITAKILSVTVRAGDEVEQGETLVKLDPRELKARVAQSRQGVAAAQAQLRQAEKNSARVQRIYKADPGAISKAEIDRAQAALETIRAELLRTRRRVDEALTALSYTTLSAPITGRVVERYAEPGDTARQGDPLLRMYDPASLRLEANVRESIASKLKKRQKLKIRIDSIDREAVGSVDEIVPSADPGSRTFLVKVNLTGDADLYPGMFGRLLIPIGQAKRIYVPNNAVITVGQLDFVIVKTAQGPIRRYVRLGSRGPSEKIEIISGLKPGEKIMLP